QHVRRRIAHQTANILGDFIRDPSELALCEGKNRNNRGSLFRIVTEDDFEAPPGLVAELDHRSSSPATMLRLPRAATASATSPPSIIFGKAEKIGKQGPRA